MAVFLFGRRVGFIADKQLLSPQLPKHSTPKEFYFQMFTAKY
jgi:hypothetical protein